MKISENWLREFANPDCDSATLMHRLTMAGLEVESVEPLGDGMERVFVAEIVSAIKHPNADKLQVCEVSLGATERYQIVCGAPNARVGIKVPLAMIGARLPNGTEIKKAKLRDVESFGMLCSARELALADSSTGLLELPAAAPLGQPLAAYLGLPDAAVEIKLTANRPDCLSIAGLAAEVRALFGLGGRPQPVSPVVETSSEARSVSLANPADCPRYLGRVIEGLDTTAETPLWMQERLRRSGLRPISVAVDCSNYVMLELGQPTHAFALDQLRGGIEVRRAHPGEKLILLDEREVALDEAFLVIADAAQVLAVAGVMGGFSARVTPSTAAIFLESAFFAPLAIQGRARKLGLHTDASHRFERGVDPELPRVALQRLSALIIDIAGGKAGPITEAVAPEHLPKRPPVRLRRARLARVLGMQIADAEVVRLLAALDLQVTVTADGWEVTPPSKRFDIEIEEDLIEEVARIHGYDAVPVHSPCGEIVLGLEAEAAVSKADLRQALLARGYLETLNFSFVAAETLARWGLPGPALALSNPLSADLGVMRTSLLPGLIESLLRNQARQQERLRLFEIGSVFFAGEPPREAWQLAGVLSGSAHAEQWGERKRALDFHDVKGDLENLFALTGQAGEFQFLPADAAWLHAGQSARIERAGQAVGVIGCLDPRLATTLGLAADSYVFELDLAAICRRDLPKTGELSRFPSLRRDLALVVADAVAFAAITTAARAALGDLLKECVLFDEFRGPGLPEGTRSLAIGLILQDTSRTLTEQDVDQGLQAVIDRLERDTGARLRG